MEQFAADGHDVRDPHPEHARRRREMPVASRPAWGAAGETVDGFELYRYDDCAAVLRDNETFSSESIRAGMSAVMGPYPLVGMDEPDHKRLRSLVAQAFRHKTLAHLEDDLVVPIVDEMIDQLRPDTDETEDAVRKEGADGVGDRLAQGGGEVVPLARVVNDVDRSTSDPTSWRIRTGQSS